MLAALRACFPVVEVESCAYLRLAVERDGAYSLIEVQRLEPFTEELRNLVGAINGTDTLRVSPAWGRHIVEVLLAAEESSRTGREVAIRSSLPAGARALGG